MNEPRDRARVLEVFRRVGEILHYFWDPIGVARVPQARDEYEAYVPRVTSMLMQGAGAEELAAFLTRTATETIGLSETPEGAAHSKDVAELLIEHFTALAAGHETG